MGDQRAAVSCFAEIESQFSGDSDPRVVAEVAAARVRRGTMMLDEERLSEALTLFRQVVRDAGELDSDVAQYAVAQSLAYQGWALGGLDRWGEALARYEELQERFFGSSVPEIRVVVAAGLEGKAMSLMGTQRYHEALDTIDLLRDEFGNDSSEHLSEPLGDALLTATEILIYLKRYDDAASTLREYLERYWEGASPPRQAAALELETRIALDSGHPGRARVLSDRVLAITSPDDAGARFVRARAEYNDALALEELSQPAQARANYAGIVRRYGTDSGADVRRVVELAQSELARLQGATE